MNLNFNFNWTDRSKTIITNTSNQVSNSLKRTRSTLGSSRRPLAIMSKRNASNEELDLKSPKKIKASGARKEWTAKEEAIFFELVDKVVKEHITAAANADGRLKDRGTNGVRRHWDSVSKKLK